MSTSNHTKYYAGLNGTVPNTVSRNTAPNERSFLGVTAESGKPILDSEVNLRQDLQNYLRTQVQRWVTPSGWFRRPGLADAVNDWILGTVPDQFQPIGVVDGGFPLGAVYNVDGSLIDAVMLPKRECLIAGLPVTLEYTNTSASGYNLFELEAATVFNGAAGSLQRSDFGFLEMWLALVKPAAYASAYVQVVDANTLVGSLVTLNGNVLTAVAGAPGVDEFEVDTASALNTAANMAAAINDVGNSFSGDVDAVASGAFVIIRAVTAGVVGNALTLTVTPSVPGNIIASAPTLSGGVDGTNKPAPDKLWRHGNTQSHEDSWLDDDLVDPTLKAETSLRVQIQYRVRTTGATEGVNFKVSPDGFSNGNIYGQGSTGSPDNSYPFVPADGESTQGSSSALAFGIVDSGLWIAGDGSVSAAQDLQTMDGFVYAIPLWMIFRHNNVSSAAFGFRGFDPINNANGAPRRAHGGYNGPLGAIPAGVSDRPDGEFCDVIQRHAVLDIRKHITPSGVDYQREVLYQLQSLLDGSLRTWAIDIADKQTLGGSSGDVSTRPLVCNEIGRGPGVSEGGTAPFSGDTDRGEFIRNFDHIARRFADQPVSERVVIAFYPGDRPDAVSQGDPATYAFGTENPGKYVVKPGGGTPVSEENWYEGDELHLDLTQLDVSTLGGFFQGLDGGGSSAAGIGAPVFTTYAPVGTRITDVLSIYHDDGHYDLVGPGSTAVDQRVEMAQVSGLGTTHLVVTLDNNPTPVTGGIPSGILAIGIVGGGAGYSIGDPLTIGPPDVPGVQATAEVLTVDGGGAILTILITNAGSGYYTTPSVTAVTGGAGAVLGATIAQYRMVGDVLVDDGSPRRIFLEVEITYPSGLGLTDTPDLEVSPDAALYDGSNGVGPGPSIDTSTTQRPNDFEARPAPLFRQGFREVQVEYVANDTVSLLGGSALPGTPIGAVNTETLVSRNTLSLVFPRRVYGQVGTVIVNDTTDTVNTLRVVNESTTEYGSSSRLVNLSNTGLGQAIPLSGDGHTLCEIQYYAQDPVPNYGAAGGGYQVAVYFRTNAPQTAGTKESDITTAGSGTLPSTLTVEPLALGQQVVVSQRGVGSTELAYPYIVPGDQIPINDGTALTGLSPNQIAGTTGEDYFQATLQTVVMDFNADTGLINLHPMIQADVTVPWIFGGTTNSTKPRKDAEFRAFYPAVETGEYRPTTIAQPLSGAVRHKVIQPCLARISGDVPGTSNGLLFRDGDLVLVVLSRFATLDANNTILFTDSDNTTCAAVYRVRNNLLVV